MNIQKVLLKVWRAIRDFVTRHIDSGVAPLCAQTRPKTRS